MGQRILVMAHAMSEALRGPTQVLADAWDGLSAGFGAYSSSAEGSYRRVSLNLRICSVMATSTGSRSIDEAP